MGTAHVSNEEDDDVELAGVGVGHNALFKYGFPVGAELQME